MANGCGGGEEKLTVDVLLPCRHFLTYSGAEMNVKKHYVSKTRLLIFVGLCVCFLIPEGENIF